MKFRKPRHENKAVKKDLVDDIKRHFNWVFHIINLMIIYNLVTVDLSFTSLVKNKIIENFKGIICWIELKTVE